MVFPFSSAITIATMRKFNYQEPVRLYSEVPISKLEL